MEQILLFEEFNENMAVEELFSQKTYFEREITILESFFDEKNKNLIKTNNFDEFEENVLSIDAFLSEDFNFEAIVLEQISFQENKAKKLEDLFSINV